MEIYIEEIGNVTVIDEFEDYNSYVVITEKGEMIVIDKEVLDIISK